jgi:hypothetical protein
LLESIGKPPFDTLEFTIDKVSHIVEPWGNMLSTLVFTGDGGKILDARGGLAWHHHAPNLSHLIEKCNKEIKSKYVAATTSNPRSSAKEEGKMGIQSVMTNANPQIIREIQSAG